jgi:hypothetical protein
MREGGRCIADAIQLLRCSKAERSELSGRDLSIASQAATEPQGEETKLVSEASVITSYQPHIRTGTGKACDPVRLAEPDGRHRGNDVAAWSSSRPAAGAPRGKASRHDWHSIVQTLARHLRMVWCSKRTSKRCSCASRESNSAAQTLRPGQAATHRADRGWHMTSGGQGGKFWLSEGDGVFGRDTPHTGCLAGKRP